MNIKDSLREIKELQAVNSILSCLHLCCLFFSGSFFFPVSAHFRFANRFKSKSKTVNPGVYEFLHLQILNYPLHSSVRVPGCMKSIEDLAQVQRGNGCEWVFIFGSFNFYKVYLHLFEFIYICTNL